MTEKQMFDYLVAGGLSPIGAAALMGNFRAESNFNSRNLQNSYQGKLGHTDDSYTEAVDNSSYTNFVRDGAGYGLAQWTYWSRKENLLNFAKSAGASIGDKVMQLNFTLWELNGYKAVLEVLKTATSVREASDVVLKKYEQPADQSDAVQVLRAGYGQEIYDRCTGKTESNEEVEKMTEAQLRQKVVDIAVAWYGCKESNGSHKQIIDVYNGHKPLARSYAVKYTDAWCATYVSAVSIKAGLTAIIPTECGCGQMIALFQALNRWVENDAYVPEPGDVIFYDWDDSGKGDNTGWPDHVGLVVSVSGSTIKVIEGNMSNAVGYRNLAVGARYIRGYGVPDYASKATAQESSSGSGNSGTSGSTSSGGGLSKTPAWVGEVTADTLNVRSWAGTENPNIKSWPTLSKGNLVDVCDSVKASDGDTWYYIRIDGRIYGFVHSDYIKKAGSGSASINVGDVVQFTGSKHYTSANATNAKGCKPGKAKVTAIYESGKHPYHLVNISGGGSTVYGWVDKSSVTV